MFDVVKSKRSKRVLSKSLKLPKSPKDNVVGIAINEIMKNNITQAFVLEILNLSIKVAQGPSTMLMPEVSAAQKRSTKNAQETTLPKGIFEKIIGSVTKTSPAPEFGSILKENTAGKIIIPANIANIVSDKIIV